MRSTPLNQLACASLLLAIVLIECLSTAASHDGSSDNFDDRRIEAHSFLKVELESIPAKLRT